MKKQTAVNFFYWELIQRIDFTPMGGWDIINNILEQAKEKEKEQIMNAHKDNAVVYEMDANGQAEQYYNETYNK